MNKPTLLDEDGPLAKPPTQHSAAGHTAAFSWDSGELESRRRRPPGWLETGSTLLSGRFVVGSRLGSGGMGTAYRALDTQVGADVALKILHLRGAAGILHLKREFRSLANLAHPNLIDLYELYCDESSEALPVWFFTMRLVAGEDFRSAIRGGAAPGADAGCDFEKLRRLLPQLVSGVSALHTAGKLHRDLKPSNVLVDAGGKVVILDLGLARDLGSEESSDDDEAGTPPYMAPELYLGTSKPSRETDWYSVGVMLFEAMTGRLPNWAMPQRASSLTPNIPPDLDELCATLLASEPSARPVDTAIAAQLGSSLEPPVLDVQRSFVGRSAELSRLEELFRSLAPGAPVITEIQGASGIGKTALAHHFAALAEHHAGALVLKSRCYEREMVPFKAVDAIIDELSEELGRASEPGPGRLPEDAGCALRVFPVLGRVRAFAIADAPPPGLDAHKIRERGFAALVREIEWLAGSRPLLLLIDDVQWGDADSAHFLAVLLTLATSLRLMLVLTHRPRTDAGSFLQQALDERLSAADVAVRREFFELPVMSLDETRCLADSMLGPADRAVSDRLLQESGGLPLFVCELASRSARGTNDGTAPSITSVLEERIQRLQPRARALLEVLAVASRPLERRLALEAAQVPLEDSATVHALNVGRLATTNVGPSGARLEPYHDRIREGILERLPKERLAALHGELADTLERNGETEPEWLLVHYLGAGRRELAERSAREAAARADRGLAFDRAAALYRQVLELAPEATDRWELAEKMGIALANAGRSGLAAEAFDQAIQWHTAVRAAVPATLLRLRNRAAEHYLQSARADQGIAVIKSLLKEQGFEYPSSNLRASLTVLANRLRFIARGFEFRRSAASNAALDASLESLWIASKSLVFVNPVAAPLFSGMLALKAFDHGHARYFACALSLVASQDAMMEVDYLYRRADRLSEVAQRIAKESGSPYELGYYHLARASIDWFHGRFGEAADNSDAAFQLFSSIGWSASYEIGVAHLWGLHSLAMIGDLRRLALRANQVRREALERGDIFCERSAVLGQCGLSRLASDEPELLLERAHAVMQQALPQFAVHNYHFLITRAQASFYLGQAQRAWQYVVDAWPGVASAFFDKIACVRDELLQLRAHAAIAAAETLTRRDTLPGPHGKPLNRAGLLKLASRDADTIAGHRLPQCVPFAALIRAALARVTGDRATARQELTRAATGFDAAKMAHYREVSRYCRDRLERSDPDAAAPPAWFAEQGVVRPQRFVKALAPAL
jgi:serine/threonine protein kinase